MVLKKNKKQKKNTTYMKNSLVSIMYIKNTKMLALFKAKMNTFVDKKWQIFLHPVSNVQHNYKVKQILKHKWSQCKHM